VRNVSTLVEDRIYVVCEPLKIIAVELDISRVRDPVGEIPCVADPHVSGIPSPHHKRRCLNASEDWPQSVRMLQLEHPP